MAKARKYALNLSAIEKGQAKKKIAALKGQAKIVFDALKNEALKDGACPQLATFYSALLEGRIETRQSVYRVTLYYMLIFKSWGIMSTFEDMPSEVDEVESVEVTE